MADELFRSKWALVTGASSGLGQEFARQLGARGANLALVARSEGKLAALAAELSGVHSIQTRIFPTDLSERGAVEDLARRVRDADISVEHLVNNAGVGDAAAFVDSDLSRQTNMVRLNCEALVALTHCFLPDMVRQGSGGVLQVASIQAFVPVPGMAVYSASKAFVRVFTEALAAELQGSGVRMTVVCPGHVETGFQEAAGFANPKFTMVGQLSADVTVRLALEGYVSGKRAVVPGGLNRLGAFAARMTPTRLATLSAGRILRKLGRED